MKHILNNLSEEEKNAIREQHTGGMKVMTENFNKLINSKLGDSKPLVSEQPLKDFKKLPSPKNSDIKFSKLPSPKNSDIEFSKLPLPKNKTNTKLTEPMMLLMKKVYLRYKPLGRNGIDTNKKKDDEVLQIQKYFNSTGTLGKGQKYDLLKENGIFDGDTFWQVNNTLGAVDRVWWLKNKY
jgi:hypothetical protein